MITTDPYPRQSPSHKTPDQIRASFSFVQGVNYGGVIYSSEESLDKLIEEAKEMITYYVTLAPKIRGTVIEIAQGKYGWLGSSACMIYCLNPSESTEVVVSSRLEYLENYRDILLKANPGKVDFIKGLLDNDIAMEKYAAKFS